MDIPTYEHEHDLRCGYIFVRWTGKESVLMRTQHDGVLDALHNILVFLMSVIEDEEAKPLQKNTRNHYIPRRARDLH